MPEIVTVIGPCDAIDAPLLGAANVQLPAEFTDARSVVFDANATVFAADRYMPFVGTVDAVGTNRAACNSATPVMFWLLNGIAAVGKPVPSRRMQFDSPVAKSAC